MDKEQYMKAPIVCSFDVPLVTLIEKLQPLVVSNEKKVILTKSIDSRNVSNLIGIAPFLVHWPIVAYFIRGIVHTVNGDLFSIVRNCN